jgi:hypothetical protein
MKLSGVFRNLVLACGVFSCGVACCVLSAGPRAFGQATTSLRGTIKDPSGAVVPGATITVTDNANGTVFTAASGGAGYYQFPQIPPAKYKITVAAPGFGAQSKAAELLVNQPATIDFALTVNADAVTVDVSGSAQTLNTSDATIGNSVNNEMIQALPMDGRDPTSLLSLQPGVLYIGTSSDSRNGSVSGGRSDQGNVTLDGIDDNDQLNGYAFSGVLRSTLDSTEEFRVVTADANADAGRSSGAQVSLITKSGTNQFHGALYEYYRGSFSHANDWFIKQAQLESGEANEPVKYVQNVFGGTFGGPIKKDKLFFFFNYEGYRNAINQSVTQTVPTTSFLAGQVGYVDTTGATQFLTTPQIATLDAGCTLCSAPGVDQALLNYYANIPTANGAAEGDGINSGSYVFSSPNPNTQNTSIVKLDYNISSKQHLFGRGNLQKDTSAGTVNFPGQPSSSVYEDNTKGMAFGHTWSITPTLSNDIRYGYVRQANSSRGIGQGAYVDVRFLSQPTAQTRSTIFSLPLNTVNENLSWTKGSHTIQVGGNWRGFTANTSTDANSYSNASTNPYWLGGNPPDPSSPTYGLGYNPVSSSFLNSYEIAYATIIGTVPALDAQYNYAVSSPTTASLLPSGQFISRHFKTNEFEYYVQDQWRVQPNLTVTFGIRHSLLATPYETKGQQIAPTIDTHAWFLERGYAAAQGQVYEPNLTFEPAGKANGRPGFWPREKLNLAPRFAIVYSPDNKTTIRMGAGIYYDHYGQSIAQRFSQNGSFGLSTTLQNSAGTIGYSDAPRFTGPHDLPNINVGSAPTNETYPYTPLPQFAITWGVDNKLKTPYSEAFNFSIQRELPGGFLLETNYLGRLGRHLLQQIDLAEPTNFNDPQGGGNYFAAGSELSKLVDANGGNPCASVPAIPYFEDVFSYMQGFNPAIEADGVTPNPCPTPNASATQAVYTYEWAPYRYGAGETTSLADLDFFCYNGTYGVGYNCPAQSRFWQPQFSSLYAWSTIGMSYYNAAEITLRHPSSHGLAMDFSYTFSKSIDMGSDVERADFFGGSGGGFGPIQNSWNPSLNRGVSDFDTRHLITVDWAYALPVGRGKAYLGNSNHLVDSLIGGWQWAGLSRWSSGIPFSVYEPGWTTNWELEGWGVNTVPVKVRKHLTTGSNPVVQVFDNPDAINNGVTSGSPVRLPYPGEAGTRNAYRGDGYFNIDSSLSKVWSVKEIAKIKLAWEVYNVTNTPRFNTYSLNTGLTSGTLGAYSSTLTTYRRMQFGLRVDF